MQSRLSEKLKLAGTVLQRQHTKIEKRADSIIEREQHIERMTEKAFAPHETMLDETEKGLEQLERELAVLSNDPLQDGTTADKRSIDRQGHSIVNK